MRNRGGVRVTPEKEGQGRLYPNNDIHVSSAWLFLRLFSESSSMMNQHTPRGRTVCRVSLSPYLFPSLSPSLSSMLGRLPHATPLLTPCGLRHESGCSLLSRDLLGQEKGSDGALLLGCEVPLDEPQHKASLPYPLVSEDHHLLTTHNTQHTIHEENGAAHPARPSTHHKRSTQINVSCFFSRLKRMLMHELLWTSVPAVGSRQTAVIHAHKQVWARARQELCVSFSPNKCFHRSASF